MNRWDVADAVVDSTLTPIERLVMLVLVKRADTESAEIPEQFSPSLNLLARETGLARSTVAKTLNSLEAGGWVERRRPTKRAQLDEHARTHYRLMPSPADIPGPRDGLAEVRDTDQAGPRDGRGYSDNRTEVVRGADTITPRSSESSDLHDTPCEKSSLVFLEDFDTPDPWATVPPQSRGLTADIDDLFGVSPRRSGSGYAISCGSCSAGPGEPCWDDWSDGRSDRMHPCRTRAASDAF